jgi:hypothetical protein
VPEQLFLFLQMEFPWELGPPAGRYLLRTSGSREPERVIVLGSSGAARRPGRLASRRRLAPEPDAAVVATSRATVIDPVPLSSERQAQKWLSELDPEREIEAGHGALNRMLFSYRIAHAAPDLHEVTPRQALVIRTGWGEGEEVAYGRWREARELPWREPRTRRRTAALRPEERLAALLSGRERALLSEELALRARLDLDAGRLGLASIELERAYAILLVELAREEHTGLAPRIGELEGLRAGAIEAARAAELVGPEEPAEPVVRHALERLEAALRARSAAGPIA